MLVSGDVAQQLSTCIDSPVRGSGLEVCLGSSILVSWSKALGTIVTRLGMATVAWVALACVL